jgi:hypothetical protein
MLIKTHIEDDFLFVLGWSSECDHALYGPPLPLLDDPAKLLLQLKKCHDILRLQTIITEPEEGLYIVLLNENWASSFEEIGAQIFTTRDDDNYLYRTVDVANPDGKLVANRLTKIRRFLRTHGPLQARDLNASQVQDAEKVIKNWYQNKSASFTQPPNSDHQRLLLDDYASAMLTLKNLEALPIHGSVYYLNHEPVGVLSTVPFHEDTLLGLNFKCLQIQGLADVMFTEFARKISSDYEYLNTGQDLDIPSLRSFKEEWKPCRMLKTYRAYLPREILNAVG